MCMNTPYFAGTSMSFAHAGMPPTEMATTAKSTPPSASRRSVVELTNSLRCSDSASSLASLSITDALRVDVHQTELCSLKARYLQQPAHEPGNEHAAPTADDGNFDCHLAPSPTSTVTPGAACGPAVPDLGVTHWEPAPVECVFVNTPHASEQDWHWLSATSYAAPPRCGVSVRRGTRSNTLELASGSSGKTSRAAPPRWPDTSASTNASWSSTVARAVLMR